MVHLLCFTAVKRSVIFAVKCFALEGFATVLSAINVSADGFGVCADVVRTKRRVTISLRLSARPAEWFDVCFGVSADGFVVFADGFEYEASRSLTKLFQPCIYTTYPM